MAEEMGIALKISIVFQESSSQEFKGTKINFGRNFNLLDFKV